ncbi:hypothetical protein IW261DRAFT_1420301 [Armillaria novae-zelandiae]|uniref:Uncharacterized protein n=1 Tax=Armillaria novae-zelandiae TaxID=153914 RepID=A0AA39P7X7_9AGAR|nr:hypothetical protein IW261DRAFT_1420301 [Armillaria novae-zelandiae]
MAEDNILSSGEQGVDADIPLDHRSLVTIFCHIHLIVFSLIQAVSIMEWWDFGSRHWYASYPPRFKMFNTPWTAMLAWTQHIDIRRTRASALLNGLGLTLPLDYSRCTTHNGQRLLPQNDISTSGKQGHGVGKEVDAALVSLSPSTTFAWTRRMNVRDFCLDTTYRHPASSNDVTRTPRVWIPLTTLAVVLPRHIDVWQTRGQEHLKKCGWHMPFEEDSGLDNRVGCLTHSATVFLCELIISDRVLLRFCATGLFLDFFLGKSDPQRLKLPHVDLVQDPIKSITPNSILTESTIEHPVDRILLATRQNQPQRRMGIENERAKMQKQDIKTMEVDRDAQNKYNIQQTYLTGPKNGESSVEAMGGDKAYYFTLENCVNTLTTVVEPRQILGACQEHN